MELTKGFYYNKDESGIIYEVLENTDKDWLQEEPDTKLLVDTWVLTKIKSKKLFYETNGILTPIKDFNTSSLSPLKFKHSKLIDNMGLELVIVSD